MSQEPGLRRIRPAAVPAALERARTYRLLNEPEQAESIGLDILAIDADNQDALKLLIMALTDQFRSRPGLVEQAKQLVGRLAGEYERHYFAGLVFERDARAHLTRGMSASFAHGLFVEAIACYDRAEAVRPPDTDDPILRRNGCVRTMAAEQLQPMMEATEQQLE